MESRAVAKRKDDGMRERHAVCRQGIRVSFSEKTSVSNQLTLVCLVDVVKLNTPNYIFSNQRGSNTYIRPKRDTLYPALVSPAVYDVAVKMVQFGLSCETICAFPSL